jgi:D-glycero-alpha-D-manno-heptose-7-phosphate kinase
VIVARAPLRFSLGGGGSDLPAYADRHGGFVVSAAIDKHVYVTASRRFDREIRVSYSRTEIVSRAADVQHPIVREALASLGIDDAIEITSVADLPANSGLGSSGTFTVALLQALHAFQDRSVDARRLAEEACAIEIDRLKEPVGRQDQFVAAFGGIVAMTFDERGEVDVERLDVKAAVLAELERSLVVVHTGVLRPARDVLAEQGANLAGRTDATDAMHRIKAMGHATRDLLLAGEVDRYGAMLHEHWELKRSTAGSISSPDLDAIYDHARSSGATGGKLMGAGGGGFFLFFVPPPQRSGFDASMLAAGRRLLPFRCEPTGATVLLDDRRP